MAARGSATPAFIGSINNDPKVELVLHVGDTHSGKQCCTEACNRTVFASRPPKAAEIRPGPGSPVADGPGPRLRSGR